MENFIFSVNSALPVVIAVLVGIFARKINLIPAEAVPHIDSFVFRVTIPCLVFDNIANMDIYSEFSMKLMIYCVSISLASFIILWFISVRIFSDKAMAGSFAQGSVRSSIGLLAVAIVSNIYGRAGIAALMIAFAVPIYNVMSVLMLLSCGNNGGDQKGQLKKVLKNLATNPMILGVVIGLPFALLRIEIPSGIAKGISNIGNAAAPVGLIAMGAAFNFSDATSRLRPALAATSIKLLILPAIGIPIAVMLGFRDIALCSIMLMLGSATAPGSYIMAKQMGCDAPLASNIVILTQTFFALTLTFWLFLLKSLALI